MIRTIILDLFRDIAELVSITIFLTGLMAMLMGL
jgi:hypothetical protein